MMAASPSIDTGSSESSMSEDCAADIVSKNATPSAIDSTHPFGHREQSKSPAQDSNTKTGSSSHRKKSSASKSGGANVGEESSDAGGHQANSGRKKRARSTPDDLEVNGRKSAPDLQRESSLWPGADGDGPVQSSLLEEVLAEKKMALLRSPEVMRFLQQRQALLRASQEAASAEIEQTNYSTGEAEDDSQQSS